LQLLPAEFHFTQAFEGMFIDVVRIPAPVSEKRKKVTKLYASKYNKCAAFIFEPLVRQREW
jgi:adenosylmethionine-8-amino-7-oxononanoate aminotransferase